jgi:hypothetical protein
MALFTVGLDTDRPPADAWRRLVDWPEHGRYVPLTDVRVSTAAPTGPGTVFIARTGVGRFGFDDPMEITDWQPPADGLPGRCRVEKRGRVLSGWAVLTVAARGAGARVSWHEEIAVARLPRFADPVVVLASRVVFGRVLRRLLAA